MNRKLIKKLEHNGIKFTPYKKTKEDRRDEVFFKKWGVPYSYYLYLLDKQSDVCAICFNLDRHNKNLAVDHCHNSGKIRGLLCSDCNLGIGMFRDNTESLYSAIEYLKKSIDLESPIVEGFK